MTEQADLDATLHRCPGQPQCEISESHLHHTRDDRPVFVSGWLVELVGYPEQAVQVAPPRRSPRKKRR